MLRRLPSLDWSPVEADGSERNPEVNRPREEGETVPGRSTHLFTILVTIMMMIWGRFPRVFGDKFGEEFCDKFCDEFSESPNLVMN